MKKNQKNQGNSHKVLLVGWDSADWRIIRPLIDEGKMPVLKQMMEEGVYGNLATLQPVLSPMLWTSIATGKRPYKHGIHGFVEPKPDRSNVRPITLHSRKCRALWNILQLKGYRSNVVGWWPSHPAEPISGVMVSNNYHQVSDKRELNEEWPVMKGTIHPEALKDTLAGIRFHPQELDNGELLAFIPKAEEIDQESDRRLLMCAKTLSEAISVHNAGTWLLGNKPWDFMGIYYDALDHFGHGFMKYNPPRRPHISEQDFELYKNVVQAGYRFHDMMLGTLLAMADEHTTVMLISDHGFHPDHLRPKDIPMEPAGPAIEHRELGIFVAKGPELKKGVEVFGANLLDVTPTILNLFDLPVGEDMDGRVITDIYQTPHEVKIIPTWESVEGEDGQNKGEDLDEESSDETMDQLVALGYVDPLPDNLEERVSNIENELQYNLACAYMDGNEYRQAAIILKKLFENEPFEYRYGMKLAFCYQALNASFAMKPVYEAIRNFHDAEIAFARKSLETIGPLVNEFRQLLVEEWLVSKEVEKKEKELAKREGKKDTSARERLKKPDSLEESQAGEALEEDDRIPNFAILTSSHQKLLQDLNKKSNSIAWFLYYLEGCVSLAQGYPKEARKCFEYALELEPNRPVTNLVLAESYLQENQYQNAQNCFEQALEFDPENAHAHLGLARVYIALELNTQAASSALESTRLRFINPYAHFCLGSALRRLGRVDEAIKAFEKALEQAPYFPEVHAQLAQIYEKNPRLKDPEKSKNHKALEAEQKVAQKVIPKQIQKDDPFFKLTNLPKDTTPKDIKKEFDELVEYIEQQIKMAKARKEGKGDFRGVEALWDGNTFLTVVSGYPRSGTSVMMQMLNLGGADILTDKKRLADDNNPKGYFEYEPVKRLPHSNTWILEQPRKVVKVVANLLPYMIPLARYRVIFMLRDVDEIMESQSKMLERLGLEKRVREKDPKEIKKELEEGLVNVREFFDTEPVFEAIFVEYQDVLKDPLSVAKRVCDFLGKDYDIQKMVKAVDPTLYRTKIS